MRWRAKTILAYSAILVGAGGGGYLLLVGWEGWRHRSIEQRIDRYQATIERCGREFDLPAELIRSVVRAESGGDPQAVSRTGAKGLMQIMPDAEKDMIARLRIPKNDLFEADYNIRIGAAYLRHLVNYYDGDLYLALAAYNMGLGNVNRLRQGNAGLSGRQLVERVVPAGTRDYCQRIIRDRWENLPAGPRR